MRIRRLMRKRQVTVNVTGNAVSRRRDSDGGGVEEIYSRTFRSWYGRSRHVLKNSYPDLLVSGLAFETTNEVPTKTLANANTNTNTKSSDNPNVGLIVGVVVGALAAVVAGGVSLRYRNNVLKSLSRGWC
jgi:hypothetical protein